MLLDLSLAISHHLLIFILFGILVAELVLVRPGMSGENIRRVASVDVWYGIVAGGIAAVGFTRAIYAAKGWGYYSANTYFWAKIGVFILIALLSLRPTMKFIRWRKRFHLTGEIPNARAVGGVRGVLWLEACLFALLPAFAAAMARGYGQ
jgi:putative membrane protein